MRDLTKEIHIPKTSNHALGIICVLLAALLIWSFQTQFSRVVRSSGKIISEDRTQLVQNLEGGILTKLNVNEGDNIRVGQVLAQLDTTRFQSQVEEIEKKIATYTLRQNRLSAELNHSLEMSIPDNYLKSYPELVMAESYLLRSRVEEYNNRINNYNSQIKLKQQELDNMEKFRHSGAVSKRDFLAIEQTLNNIRTERDNFLSDTHKRTAQEMADTVAQLALVNETIKTVKDQLARATIRSPASGTVNQIFFNTIGSVINPGQTILEIVPNDGSVLVEIRVSPKDIGYVIYDMKATLKLTAYDYSIYGTMQGRVKKIGADTVPDKENRNTPPSYVVTVVISPDSLLDWAKRGLELRTGMVVEAELEAGHMRIIDYIFRPILKARDALRTI